MLNVYNEDLKIKNMVDLSIIIVNYNGQSYLKDCIDSIYRMCNNFKFEIIIVDNNSTDNSNIFIKENFPTVRLIESKDNLGFGKGNNLGVEKALGKTILLLNNDTILLDPLLPVIETLYKDDKNGIITINMLNGNKEYISAVGKFPTPLKMIKISFLNENRKAFKTGKFDKDVYEVDWVSGAFMILRKSDFEAVNGFDSDYFMYVEDVDLCKKIKNLGKKCLFKADLSYIHFVGFNKSREHLLLKGFLTYASKHFSKYEYLIAKKMISINKLIKLIKSNIRN